MALFYVYMTTWHVILIADMLCESDMIGDVKYMDQARRKGSQVVTSPHLYSLEIQPNKTPILRIVQTFTTLLLTIIISYGKDYHGN